MLNYNYRQELIQNSNEAKNKNILMRLQHACRLFLEEKDLVMPLIVTVRRWLFYNYTQAKLKVA